LSAAVFAVTQRDGLRIKYAFLILFAIWLPPLASYISFHFIFSRGSSRMQDASNYKHHSTTSTFPACVFNAAAYKSHYADLANLTLSEALRHWKEYGILQGRTPCGALMPTCKWNAKEYTRLVPECWTSHFALRHYMSAGINKPVCQFSCPVASESSFDIVSIVANKLSNYSATNIYIVTVTKGRNKPKRLQTQFSITIRLPDTYLLGFGKSGTSFFYQVFSQNEQVASLPKELCPSYVNFHTLKSYLTLLSTYVSSPSRFLFSSCIVTENFLQLSDIFHDASRRAIYVVRDRPSQVYAGYVFWCNRFDIFCCIGGWRKDLPGATRSPELFHDIVRREQSEGVELLPFINSLMNVSAIIAPVLKLVTRRNVFVMTTENLSSPSNWDRFYAWLGSNSTHIARKRSILSTRFNANEDPGIVVPYNGNYSGTYAATSHRPMLDATRLLLKDSSRADSAFLRRNFNVII